MTPQLQQAIKLLQLSNLELADYIERELEQNPLLDREDPEGGSQASDQAGDQAGDRAGDQTGAADSTTSQQSDAADAMAETLSYSDEGFDQPDAVELTSAEINSGDTDAALDTDYDNVWNSDSVSDLPVETGGDSLVWEVSGGSNSFGAGELDLDNARAEDISLRNHLNGQINVDLEDPVDRVIASQLTEMLDESGYLTGDIKEVSLNLECDPERVTATLEKVQRFDPPGIYARDLAECLALQLRDLDRFDAAMQTLVQNLALLGKRDFATLKKLCGVDTEDLTEMVDEIKALNPKPAMAFDHTVAQPVTPDVLVRQQSGGGWAVEFNPDTLPRVLVNNRYYTAISKQTAKKNEKQYIDDCFQSANWLVKALHQRAQTILKVATELVKLQENFLTHGVQYLKPLVLHDIAELVNVHESTVSRVTNNKYMATPRGVFELKYFFDFGLRGSGGDGDTHSAKSIRFQIKNLIEAETANAILSDDKIVGMLREHGVDVARRTVAKYREALHIPSSVQRRREKTLVL